MDPNNQAGSKPLQDLTVESFLVDVLKGVSKNIAYQRNINKELSLQRCGEYASRLLKRPEVIARLQFVKSVASNLQTSLSRPDLRRILEALAISGSNPDKIASVKQLKEWEDEDKRAQDAQSNLDPAVIATRLGRYEGAPATAEHLREVIEHLAVLLNVSLTEVVRACADRDSAPPLEPTIDKSNSINNLQLVDSSNPTNS